MDLPVEGVEAGYHWPDKGAACLCTVDKDLRITLWTAPLAIRTGLPGDLMLGQHLSAAFSDEGSWEALSGALHEVLDDEDYAAGRLEYRGFADPIIFRVEVQVILDVSIDPPERSGLVLVFEMERTLQRVIRVKTRSGSKIHLTYAGRDRTFCMHECGEEVTDPSVPLELVCKTCHKDDWHFRDTY